MTLTMSRTERAMTDVTRSIPPNSARSWHGRRASQTVEDGLADAIEWYRSNERWWRPAKAATEARYSELGHTRPTDSERVDGVD